MAARQRETRHVLDDGMVIAWDSSEPDENLRQKLIEIAKQQIGGIVIGTAETGEPSPSPPKASSPEPRKSRRRRRIAA